MCNVDANRHVLELWSDDDKRNVNLNYWDDDWNRNYRFLRVRNSLIFLLTQNVRSFLYGPFSPPSEHSTYF